MDVAVVLPSTVVDAAKVVAVRVAVAVVLPVIVVEAAPALDSTVDVAGESVLVDSMIMAAGPAALSTLNSAFFPATLDLTSPVATPALDSTVDVAAASVADDRTIMAAGPFWLSTVICAFLLAAFAVIVASASPAFDSRLDSAFAVPAVVFTSNNALPVPAVMVDVAVVLPSMVDAALAVVEVIVANASPSDEVSLDNALPPAAVVFTSRVA